MHLDSLVDSKVIALLGISLLLLVLGALKQRRSYRARGDVITSSQAGGFLLWQALDRWVNYILYPVVVSVFGIIRGGFIMTGVTLIQNVAYIMVNNLTEEDWTFMSWVTYLRDSRSHVWPLRYYRVLQKLQVPTLGRFMIWLLWLTRKIFNLEIRRINPTNPITFLFLSVWKDSFYAVNFLYHKKADLRRIKVMSLFLLSHVICNAVWAPIARVIGGIAQYIFDLFFSF